MGTWSLNFKSFIPTYALPTACINAWKKKHFWANFAVEINNVCYRWEFNQGHIWRTKYKKGISLEEDYTFNMKRSSKKVCLKFSTALKTNKVRSTTYFSHKEANTDCKLLIIFPVSKVHYQVTPYNESEFSIKIEDPSKHHIIRLR